MCTGIGHFLYVWQDLIGALIGGAMGFGGAYTLAKTQEHTQTKSAARIVAIVHEGYIATATRWLKHEHAMDVLVSSEDLPRMLTEKPLEITPLYLPNREKLSALNDDDLHEHLQLFYLNSRQLENNYVSYMQTAVGAPGKGALLDKLRTDLLRAAYNGVCANYLLNKHVIKKGFKKNPAMEANYKTHNGILEYSAD
jgi:hypothetical protein